MSASTAAGGVRDIGALLALFERPAAQRIYTESVTQAEHALQCAALAEASDAGDALIAAALLHDVPEDCGGETRLKEIAEKFGPRVEKVVRGCSDSLVEDSEEKAPWKERKEVRS